MGTGDGPVAPQNPLGPRTPAEVDKLIRRHRNHRPTPVKQLALGLPAKAWRKIAWREGSAGQLSSRFARLRILTGDFSKALAALLGKDAAGLSASAIGRHKDGWLDEHAAWQKRDLSAKRYVYIWADGMHLEARLEAEKQCILVLIGATPEGGNEELVASPMAPARARTTGVICCSI